MINETTSKLTAVMILFTFEDSLTPIANVTKFKTDYINIRISIFSYLINILVIIIVIPKAKKSLNNEC